MLAGGPTRGRNLWRRSGRVFCGGVDVSSCGRRFQGCLVPSPRSFAESGLHFLRNRYYDSRTGTFVSQDPIGVAGGVNLYEYVGNKPINFTDPFGLEPSRRAPIGRFGDYIIVQGPLGPRFIDRNGNLVTSPNYVDSFTGSARPVAETISDPGRSLRTTGRVLSETGHPTLGRILGIGGLVLEPAGPGRLTGLAVGGTIGAAAGRALGRTIGTAGGPVGAIFGATVGGAAGGAIGSGIDTLLGYSSEGTAD